MALLVETKHILIPVNYLYSYCAILLGLLIILYEKKVLLFFRLISPTFILELLYRPRREYHAEGKKKKRRLPVAFLANKMHNIGSTCKHALGALMDLRAPTTDAVTVVSARAFVGSERDGNTRHSWIP